MVRYSASSEKEASEAESKRFVTHYQFQHDRVQQAAYALMDEQEKKAIHLKIGRLLWIEMPLQKSAISISMDS